MINHLTPERMLFFICYNDSFSLFFQMHGAQAIAACHYLVLKAHSHTCFE